MRAPAFALLFIACVAKPVRLEPAPPQRADELTYVVGGTATLPTCSVALTRVGDSCIGTSSDSSREGPDINFACPGHILACRTIFNCRCEVVGRPPGDWIVLLNGTCADPGDAGPFVREFAETLQVDAGVFMTCTRREPMKLGDWSSDLDD